MRAALGLILAVGLPVLHGAMVSDRRPGRLAAFASPSFRPLQQQPRNTYISMARTALQKTRRRHGHKLSSLTCTAAAAPVTVLEGAFNIDGFRSNYFVAKPQGNEEGKVMPPLVLIHGFGSNKAHFSKNLEALASATGSAVYALDLLGHGQSAKPQSVSYDCSCWDWQVETLVKDVIGQKVFLVGHSIGGYIAMRLAARSPRDVMGLCLIAPAGRYGVLHPLSFNVPLVGLGPVASALGAQTLSKFSTPKAMRSTLEFLYKDASAVSQELVEALSAPWSGEKSQQAGRAMCKEIYQSRLEAPWDKLISSDEVRTVVPKRTRSGPGEDTFVTMTYCGPMLTLWGEHDSFLPPDTNIQTIKELRPDALSEICMIDAGHCPHDESPQQVNALIAEWVKKVQREDAEFPIPRKPRYRNAPIVDESVWKF